MCFKAIVGECLTKEGGRLGSSHKHNVVNFVTCFKTRVLKPCYRVFKKQGLHKRGFLELDVLWERTQASGTTASALPWRSLTASRPAAAVSPWEIRTSNT